MDGVRQAPQVRHRTREEAHGDGQEAEGEEEQEGEEKQEGEQQEVSVCTVFVRAMGRGCEDVGEVYVYMYVCGI